MMSKQMLSNTEIDLMRKIMVVTIMIGLIIMLFGPYCINRLFAACPFLSDDMISYLRGIRFKDTLPEGLFFSVLFCSIMYVYIYGDYTSKRVSLLFKGFELSDFEYGIDDFVELLTQKDYIAKWEITPNKDLRGGEGFAWYAKRRGIIIGSNSGKSLDYLLLNLKKYNGAVASR